MDLAGVFGNTCKPRDRQAFKALDHGILQG